MLHETDLSRADLNLLVLFETVMEQRHVGRSASRLSLSPSAVSHGPVSYTHLTLPTIYSV